MLRSLWLGSFALLFAATTAQAQHKPPTAGEETRKLESLAADMKWRGRTLAGAMGENSPEMPSTGTMNCNWAINNLHLLCTIKGIIGDPKSKDAFRWNAQFTMNYDYFAKQYRSTMIDNMSSATLLTGSIEGNKIVLIDALPMEHEGKKMRSRLTMDWSNPKQILLIGEQSVDDKEWVKTQEVTLTPRKRHPFPGPRAS